MKILGILLFSLALTNGGRVRRVIGGSDAYHPEFSYQGRIFETIYEKKPGSEPVPKILIMVCSGIIINEKWILTSADCVYNKDANRVNHVLSFGAGAYSHGEPFDNYVISSILINPRYKHDLNVPVEGNIALLELEDSIKWNERVKPIELPTTDFVAYGDTGDFAGWGIGSDNAYPKALQKITLNITFPEECWKYWKTIGRYHLCTFNKDGGRFLEDDVGGPLVVNSIVVGIATHPFPPIFDYSHRPNVFTRVYNYLYWIKTTATYTPKQKI